MAYKSSWTESASSLRGLLPFSYLGSNILSRESDINMYIRKTWTVIDSLSTIWKSNLSDTIKRESLQAVATWVLLYGCTRWTLTKWLEKKLDENYKRRSTYLEQIWEAATHKMTTVRPLASYLINHPRRAKHAGHCWGSKNELISIVLFETPFYWYTKDRRSALCRHLMPSRGIS